MNVDEMLIRYKNLRANIKYTLLCVLNKEFRDDLQKNSKFMNIHKGERCFILGNGPSLKEDDITLLKDEVVFSVNQFSRSPYLNAVRPDYHFWSDPNFFKLDPDNSGDMELLEVMKKINTSDNHPECFFPIQQKEFVKRFDLDKVLKVNYYYSASQMYDNYSKNIDYTKMTPGFSTVVHWCISMAIYMGFKEIYILGCDNTSLMVNYKSAMSKNDNTDYSYDITPGEKQRLERMIQRQTLEQQTLSAHYTFRDYRLIYQYCRSKDIKIVNCSAQTVIDSIPKMRLNDVLNGK